MGDERGQWLVAYVPRHNRGRVQETADAACVAVLHYVAGNVATSIFAAVTVLRRSVRFCTCRPRLLLAVLAGVCDFVPVLGFIVSAIPAVLLALTVSTTTAIIVASDLHRLSHGRELPDRSDGVRRAAATVEPCRAARVCRRRGTLRASSVRFSRCRSPRCTRASRTSGLRDYLGRDAADTHRRIERPENVRSEL